MSLWKHVLKKEQASDVVFEFKAREFPLIITPSASGFVAGTAEKTSDFQINPHVAEQAGIAKLQSDALNDRIEEEALQQLRSVQEKAYTEAYDLGISEGREQAHAEHRQVLETKIQHFDGILKDLEEMKARIAADHEVHILTMIQNLASRIAMKEIKLDPASIMPVVLQIVADAQSDELVTIRVSPDDYAFLEKAREISGKQAEALRRVKFESADNITTGGCYLESNYGSIDATLETRVERAWQIIVERLPRAETRSPSGDGTGESSGS